MYQPNLRMQQQFGQQNNQFSVSPRQNQFSISPRQNQFVQSPKQFQQSPDYNNVKAISPQLQKFFGSPQQKQLRQPSSQQSPTTYMTQKQEYPISQQKKALTNRNPNQSQNLQNQYNSQPQTQEKQIRHVERPLYVTTIDEIEAPWKLKCGSLERQILELQIQIRKNNGGALIEETVQEVYDDTKVKNLQKQKQELEKKINGDEQLMQELRISLEEINQDYEETTTQKISYVSNEVETWIKKYQNLEKNYIESQQKIQDLKKQLKQVEVADKAVQDQKKVETRQQVRKGSIFQ